MSIESSVERLSACVSSDLNAIVAFDAHIVRAQAENVRDGPLGGSVVAVKDNICTAEYPTTCGSEILRGYVSPFEATAVEMIRKSGGIVGCKTNLDEFGMGSTTEHSIFGRTLHPLDATLVPGGSSGGSAAAVASGAVRFAIGSETGGSVRQPASFCGIAGIKPTYGRVSRFGLVAFGSSLDQIGVFGNDVSDAALLLSCITGHDARDSTSVDAPPVARDIDPANLHGLRIGVPAEYFPTELDAGVRAACDRTLQVLRDAGAVIEDVSLPTTDCAVAAYYVIAPAEASSNLARFDGVRYGMRASETAGGIERMYRDTRGRGFGAEVKRRIIIGTYVLSAGYYEAYYGKAQQTRMRIAAEFRKVFNSGVDLLFTPTTSGTAFAAGEHEADPLSVYMADRFVCPVNLAGLPAMSLPVGRSDGLPVGAQLIAPAMGEERMIGAALSLESLLNPVEEAR